MKINEPEITFQSISFQITPGGTIQKEGQDEDTVYELRF